MTGFRVELFLVCQNVQDMLSLSVPTFHQNTSIEIYLPPTVFITIYYHPQNGKDAHVQSHTP